MHDGDFSTQGDAHDGGSGMDWFFADLDGYGTKKSRDKVSGASNGEVIVSLG